MNRPECCERCQDCSRLELHHRLAAGNGIFQYVQRILLQHLHLPWEVLPVLLLTWPLAVSEHPGTYGGTSGGWGATLLDITWMCRKGKSPLQRRDTHTKYFEGPARPSHSPQGNQALVLGIQFRRAVLTDLLKIPPGNFHSPAGQGTSSEKTQPRNKALCPCVCQRFLLTFSRPVGTTSSDQQEETLRAPS